MYKQIRCFIIKLLCFAIIVFNVCNGEQNLHDSCAAARNGAPGTCKFINDCQKVINDIVQHQLLPNQCGFIDKKQVVCCPNDMQEIITTEPPKPNRISQKSI